MNSAECGFSIKELFESGDINHRLEQYLLYCAEDRDGMAKQECEAALSDGNSNKRSTRKKQNQCKSVFPNLAGFCRHLGVSTEELEDMLTEFPAEYGRIITVLEDEALNSAISPTVLSSYLKKRLGYEKSGPPSPAQMQICFEHDIIEDGE